MAKVHCKTTYKMQTRFVHKHMVKNPFGKKCVCLCSYANMLEQVPEVLIKIHVINERSGKGR